MAASEKILSPDDSILEDSFVSAAGDTTLEATFTEEHSTGESSPITEEQANMVNYEDADGTDEKDVHQRLYQLKLKRDFDRSDLLFWFGQFKASWRKSV